MPPGDHTIQVALTFQGNGYGVFSYLRGYKFEVKSSHSFTAVEGKALDRHGHGVREGRRDDAARAAADHRVAREGLAAHGAAARPDAGSGRGRIARRRVRLGEPVDWGRKEVKRGRLARRRVRGGRVGRAVRRRPGERAGRRVARPRPTSRRWAPGSIGCRPRCSRRRASGRPPSSGCRPASSSTG